MNVQTYLFFRGDCREAIELYQRALGMTTSFLQTYGDGAPRPIPEGWEDKVFHATVKFGESVVNFNDTHPHEQLPFGGFAMLAHLDSAAEAEKVFDELKVGGEVVMPIQSTPWAPRYGIVRDRFGVTWKVQA